MVEENWVSIISTGNTNPIILILSICGQIYKKNLSYQQFMLQNKTNPERQARGMLC
jgi:hypothetical protein